MPIPSWPADLPQNILAQGYKGELPNNLLRTSMDVGPAQIRRRGTVAVEPVTGNILVTPAELATLKTFYETTLLDGSLRFRWRDPLVDDDITTTLVASLSGVTLNLSLVNGTAFISNPSTDLSGYEYTKIIVTDSAGKKAVGYIKAAGTGETYGSERFTNHSWDVDTTGWTANNSATLTSVAGGQSGNCLSITENGVANPYAQQNIFPSIVPGRLYRSSIYVKQGTSSRYRFYVQYAVGAYFFGYYADQTATSSWGQVDFVYCYPVTGTQETYVLMNRAGLSSGQDLYFDEISCKQILTPSTDGVTIVSSIGGTTYNWASIDSGFNYNDTSYGLAIYATEMRFTEPPTWNWVDGYYEVALSLEILK